MKRSFFQAAVVSILLYGCTTWTLTKRLEKKLDGNYTRMLRAILNKSRWQHPTRHQLYGHLPPFTKTIQVRQTRHAGHCWRSRDELISDVLLWTPTYALAKAGRPARTYIQQLCEDMGCSPEDLPVARKGQGYPCLWHDMMMMIHNLISRAKLISSSKTIFYKEVENIKQALINNGFPNYIVDEQIKRMIKNVNQQNKHCTTPSSQQTYIKLFSS